MSQQFIFTDQLGRLAGVARPPSEINSHAEAEIAAGLVISALSPSEQYALLTWQLVDDGDFLDEGFVMGRLQ